MLPGSYLARDAHGANPGRGYVRIALVAELGRVRRGDRAHRRVRAALGCSAPRDAPGAGDGASSRAGARFVARPRRRAAARRLESPSWPRDPLPLRPLRRRRSPRGFRVSWRTVLLIAAINTGIAGVLWIEDPRPFWHPLVSASASASRSPTASTSPSPWEKSLADPAAVVAVAVGTLIGVVLVILVKGYSLEHIVDEAARPFGWNVVAGFVNGLFVSLFF